MKLFKKAYRTLILTWTAQITNFPPKYYRDAKFISSFFEQIFIISDELGTMLD